MKIKISQNIGINGEILWTPKWVIEIEDGDAIRFVRKILNKGFPE